MISTISSLIGGKSLEFGMFKDISGQFRGGKLSSDSYFSQCRELVVNTKFNKFFPELLALLPDIKKQQVGGQNKNLEFLVTLKISGAVLPVSSRQPY